MATQPDIHDVLERIYAAINSHDVDALDSLFAEDYVEHGDNVVGRAAFKGHLAVFLAAFPDLHTTVDQVLIDGELYASRTTTTGTHRSALMGIPATGHAIRVAAVDMGRISGRRLRERWGGLDTFSLLQQLGVVGSPAEPGSVTSPP